MNTEWNEIEKVLLSIDHLLESGEKLTGLVYGYTDFTMTLGEINSRSRVQNLTVVLSSPINKDEYSLYQYEIFFDPGFQNVRIQEFSWGRIWNCKNNQKEGLWLGSTAQNPSSINNPKKVDMAEDMMGKISKLQASQKMLEDLNAIKNSLLSTTVLTYEPSSPN